MTEKELADAIHSGITHAMDDLGADAVIGLGGIGDAIKKSIIGDGHGDIGAAGEIAIRMTDAAADIAGAIRYLAETIHEISKERS